MNLSRRGFLSGLLASTAAAPLARALAQSDPLFTGTLGQYNGVIFRKTLSVGDIMRLKEAAMRAKIPTFKLEDGREYYVVHVSQPFVKAMRIAA